MLQGVPATKTLFHVQWAVDVRTVTIRMEVDHCWAKENEHEGVIFFRNETYQVQRNLLKTEMKP